MSARGSGGVTSIPDTDEKTKASQGQNSSKRVSGEKSAIRKQLQIQALHFVVSRRTRRSSPNVCTGKSNPSIAPIDSHRAEAINDCIEFINSSSSLQRSNSVATNSS
ncbi:hypothetical protein Acr_15g0002360 [Actinidia rufa]|uniref:Uncharacterized protein n=1 Tax=Actinidia rufa TaxID=165716 RepID=A0A7J0FT86_9ERIC|nr:hypothetical protein Acr_15g0002360 [Actinidia rufa]